MPDIADLSPALIEDYLKEMFKIGDANRDGVLSRDEFAQVLRMSGFKFSQSAIDLMVKTADVNGDGVISFEEFVPAIMKLAETAVSSPFLCSCFPCLHHLLICILILCCRFPHHRCRHHHPKCHSLTSKSQRPLSNLKYHSSCQSQLKNCALRSGL